MTRIGETVTVRDRILRMRAELDAILAELSQPPALVTTPQSRFMKISQFAESRALSARTVRDYCELGMPHVGHGCGRRVLVGEAIAWIESDGPRRARMARRGGRG